MENTENSENNKISQLIQQIQNDIINPAVKLQNIFLKVKVLAYYLKNPKLKEWVKNELDGYKNHKDLPDYRVIDSMPQGTFFNGVWRQKGAAISLFSIPEELRDDASQISLAQGISGLESMLGNDNYREEMSGDWLALYNFNNQELLSQGNYQLINAYKPLTQSSLVQVLGTIRSRLQDLILEISDLPWKMDKEPPPSDKIAKIFQLIIHNNSGEINMSNHEQKEGDTYSIGQAGAVGRYASSDHNTFIQSESKQTLSEAAAEIQRLLQQLEASNPNATDTEKLAFVNESVSPSLKKRTAGALKAGSEAALDELLDNPYLAIGKAAIKGWMQPI